jgi:SPP1 gp7 family putative phage head morphogenesis protein
VPTITDIADAYRRALLKKERKAALRLVDAYGTAWARLSKNLEKLTAQIAEARAKGEVVNQFWLLRQQRYGDLLRQVNEEMRKFSDLAEATIVKQQSAAVKAGLNDSAELVEAAAGSADVGTVFNRLPAAAVENLVGTLGNGSPLRTLLDQLPRSGRAIVEQGLIEGVALGRNPRAIARQIREGLGGNMVRALTIARTETLHAYRQASIQNYRANSDIVTGWYWRSGRGRRCCASCCALDGTFHPVAEPFRSHPRCRCVAVPAVRGVTVDRGVDWFERQDAETKRAIIGTDKGYELYKRGELKLGDFVGLKRDPRWGDTYHQLSVKRAVAGEGQFPGDAAKPPQNIPPAPQPAPRQRSQSKQGAGPKIRARLETIAKRSRDKFDALTNERDRLSQQLLKSDDVKERRALDRKIATLGRQAVKVFRKERQDMLKALYQREKANVSAAYLDDFGSSVLNDFSSFERRRHAQGLEQFAKMIGPGLLDGRVVRINKALGGRAYHRFNVIHLSSADGVDTVIHELGHWLERNNTKIHDELQAFFQKRTANDTAESLATLTGLPYRSGETTKKDKWLDPYIGKVKQLPGGDEEGPEVLSMGLELIYNSPVDVARRDPDFFDFIMEVLRLR